ncbi:MAG: 50S ribosomal protein L11 methyltransferase [Burkholderiaceae bacterium]
MFEVAWLAPQVCVERSSDALIDQLGALSVSVEDADAGSGAEQALFGEPGSPADEASAPAAWTRSTLKALFHTEADATRAATWLAAQEWARALDLKMIAELADRDWVQLTQAQFTPSEISPGFWIVPTWHEPPNEARLVIRLDPGQAFGTGTHPTTRMCLRWIAQHAAQGTARARVLDYGCGSGILAIAAALHGAVDIDAVDIDPIAVGAAQANALANHVTLHVGAPDAARAEYDLVLANILATPLKLLAPLLSAHVAPGGSLVLAGILERQTLELTQAYAPWLALHVSDTEDGWILMTARQRPRTRVA